MIPTDYIGYIFGGLGVLSTLLLVLFLWAWCSAEEVETSEEEQRSQSGRNE